MKRIVKSRLDEHMIDLYNRVDNLKKDISVIKNNHLKHMSCTIYKIEKKVDKLIWAMVIGMGSLTITMFTLLINLLGK